ncbi:MAG: glyceraldehyde-3-phosphate dehydrogenase [Alphaproteobacteria bacterium]|nr:glyceraldehyde-3-phosphate dehydrogenase [Alphaproteobacteria bacterium]
MQNGADFIDWKAAEEIAEAMVPLIGQLYRDHGIVTLVTGSRLVLASPTEIIQAHRKGNQPFGRDLPLAATREALATLLELGLAPVEIDVGKLVIEHLDGIGPTPVADLVRSRCAGLPRRADRPAPAGRDVVLYGFGRIGRLLARMLVSRKGGGDKVNLRAIVVRKGSEDDLERRANLLRRDSVFGRFEGTVRTLPDENALLVNGVKILLLYSEGPDKIDYTAHGIHDAIVIDNSGKWRNREGLSRHLEAPGVSKVILTAPGEGDVPNIVYGINEGELSDDERTISAASCTTNAIVPVLKVLDDAYGIQAGHLETVHSYTNDQNLLDNYHKKARRGRSAALNLVITSTGAAKAVAKALPGLAGKLTGNAIRVPTPNVSLAIMNLHFGKPVTKDELGAFLYQVATDGPLKHQVGWTSLSDTVSTDLVGDTHAGTVDGTATIVHGNTAVLYVWYDNEHGYSCQVMRLLAHVAGVDRPSFP